jgi:hypothetical protein
MIVGFDENSALRKTCRSFVHASTTAIRKVGVDVELVRVELVRTILVAVIVDSTSRRGIQF